MCTCGVPRQSPSDRPRITAKTSSYKILADQAGNDPRKLSSSADKVNSAERYPRSLTKLPPESGEACSASQRYHTRARAKSIVASFVVIDAVIPGTHRCDMTTD